MSCLVSFLKDNSSRATKGVEHVSKVIDSISWAAQESYKKLNFIERRIMWFAPDDAEVIRQNMNVFDEWQVELDQEWFSRQIKFHRYKWEGARKRFGNTQQLSQTWKYMMSKCFEYLSAELKKNKDDMDLIN